MITELKVSAIENGTVIDHIPSASVFKVIKILNLDSTGNMVLFGTNLESKKYGTKGIIKVSNKFFKSDEVNKIALVAPAATLIEIRNFKVASKTVVHVPDEITAIVKCFNPNCITNDENIPTQFKVLSKDELKLQCLYCEKVTDKKTMVIK